MTRYVQGPRHAQRGPYRGILLPMSLLVAEFAVLVGLIVWMVVA